MPEQPSKNPEAARDFRVGEWLVQASLDRLSRGSTQVHLRPQLTDLLLVLARRAGRTVPKGTIVQEVWATPYVGESVLTRCITELRQALQDDARAPKVIETIPKRGYRLIAPVVFLDDPQPSNFGIGEDDRFEAPAATAGNTRGHGVSGDGPGGRLAAAAPGENRLTGRSVRTALRALTVLIQLAMRVRLPARARLVSLGDLRRPVRQARGAVSLVEPRVRGSSR